jgi:S-adenosylmethionine-dependent methyltransferase
LTLTGSSPVVSATVCHIRPKLARSASRTSGSPQAAKPWSCNSSEVRSVSIPSPAMLDKARQRLELLAADTRQRVTLLQADGENADEAVTGQRFAGVLCHGVLGYLEHPGPLVAQLCRCAGPGGIVSVMTGNAHATAVQPALERRWADALASFDVRTGTGVLGPRGRADTVEEVGELIARHGVEPERW